jgi:hypothetical protein
MQKQPRVFEEARPKLKKDSRACDEVAQRLFPHRRIWRAAMFDPAKRRTIEVSLLGALRKPLTGQEREP